MAATESLRLAIERSLAGAFDPADVLPRLSRLARLSAEGSDDQAFAHQKLAELIMDQDPWRAALYIRRTLAQRAHDDRAWATLAFCQTLLGNFRYAVTAYERAIACAPDNPWYAHNLGHLLDVALGRPERALVWLRCAHASKPDNTEFVASLAHALGRAGQLDDARALIARAMKKPCDELEALLRWIDGGAPRLSRGSNVAGPLSRRPRRPRGPLARELARGLSHLPLEARQRERAMTLARDAMAASVAVVPVSARLAENAPERATRVNVAALAAAIAYAIVFVDHVPLSAAEVAAPFRVGVAELRARFRELRARLDILRGYHRYCTAGRPRRYRMNDRGRE